MYNELEVCVSVLESSALFYFKRSRLTHSI